MNNGAVADKVTNVDIKSTQELSITAKEKKPKKKKLKPPLPFLMTCTGGKGYRGVKEFKNIKEILQNLTRQGMWFWLELIYTKDRYTNIAVYKAPDHVMAQKISRAYKELVNVDLIFRVKKQTYLINPSAVMAHPDEMKHVINRWNKLAVNQELKQVREELRYDD